MDINKALSYMFKDPTWLKKMLYLGLISLIPVFGWIVLYGWSIALLRQVIQGEDEPKLPEIDYKSQMEDGLNMFIVFLIYAFPLYIGYFFFFILPFVGMMVVSANPRSDLAGAIILPVLITLLCGSILLTPFSIVYSIFMPVVYSHVAKTRSLRAAFNFKLLFRLIKASPISWIVVLAGIYLIGTLASFGLFLCGVGILFTSIWSQMAILHFYGQAYRESTAKLALPVVL